jgi:hypothetical protein
MSFLKKDVSMKLVYIAEVIFFLIGKRAETSANYVCLKSLLPTTTAIVSNKMRNSHEWRVIKDLEEFSGGLFEGTIPTLPKTGQRVNRSVIVSYM